MKRLIFLLALTSLPAMAQDLSGVWKIDGSVEGNAITSVCTLKQTDTHITGSCTGEDDKALDVKGDVTDKNVTWKYDLEYDGTVYTLTYKGTLDTNTSIKGSITVNPSDSQGEFTAQKQEQPNAIRQWKSGSGQGWR
jgi:hypothetical protein